METETIMPMQRFLSWGSAIYKKLFNRSKSVKPDKQELENSNNPYSVNINITVNGDLKIGQK